MKPLHVDLLLALSGAGDFGLPAANLLSDVRQGRHRRTTRPDLDLALRDLADRTWVTPFTTELGAERWRLTSRGTSALQEEGLL